MVTLAPETIFYVGKLPISNTLIEVAVVDVLIIVGIYFLNKNIKKVPGIFQNIVEYVVDGFYNLTEGISQKNAAQIFPWFMSFFIFIILCNWLSLLPGFGTIGINKDGELIPIIRAAGSDLNFTLGLALISAVATHVLAIKVVGIKEYLSRYFALNPIFLFVGLLELVGEVTKVISLSFRLFGNITAGEVVLSTVSKMFAFFLPLPFMSLEIIVGLVQALVFAILTMAFMAILTTPHHEGGEH